MTLVNGARRAVFLDRDGVLNVPPNGDCELRLLPGVREGCEALRDAGFLLLVVTNQPDVSRGLLSREQVEKTNAALSAALPVDATYVCPHDDADACECRKPLPGMLLQAAREWGVDLERSFMVGDRWRDIGAGTAAGCATVFIDNEHSERRDAVAQASFTDLADAAQWIVTGDGAEPRAAEATPDVSVLRIKLFADGADAAAITTLAQDPRIRGFTTNPTLMRAAGVIDYEAFAHEVLAAVPDRPISFEVFDDDFAEMERQALTIAGWGNNVYVKIPVTNTEGVSAAPLIRRLADEGVQLNVTAILTLDQVRTVKRALAGGPSAIVSVFAGRIADTGRDPVPLMREAVRILGDAPELELLWASPRELLNIFQADAIGCHIITATVDVLKKLSLVGKDLGEYSLDTVKMFHGDAKAAGYQL